MNEKSYSNSYKEAGVDVTAGYKAVELMKEHVKRTNIPGVLSGIGGFGGLFQPSFAGMSEPVLVSGTDGVGTKLKVAMLLDKHDTIGIDAVAMCVNDVVCCGAQPLFFLDYIACGKNVPEKIAQIVAGVAEGCVQSGCALIGGETAEHPGMMPEDDYDVAGFTVGIVDKAKILDGSTLQAGDALIGLASSGVHSNGFSLVRRVFGLDEKNVNEYIPELGGTLGETLLTPTKIYVKPVLSLLKNHNVRAISHVTGGGFYENIPRMLRPGLSAKIDLASFPKPPIFSLLQEKGGISDHDMYNTFNMDSEIARRSAGGSGRRSRRSECHGHACLSDWLRCGERGGRDSVLNIAVLVSGGGTNLQALLDAQAAGEIHGGRIALVLASKPGVYALERAQRAGVPSGVIVRREFPTQEAYDDALLARLAEAKIDLVVLAGFLTIISERVVARYENRILNVHPSLIPSFCGEGFYGLRVHEEALRRGVKVTGATVHFVNNVCDGGPIVLQKAVAVEEGDTPRRCSAA